MARPSQPAAGMLRSRRLGLAQNSSSQDSNYFSDSLLASASAGLAPRYCPLSLRDPKRRLAPQAQEFSGKIAKLPGSAKWPSPLEGPLDPGGFAACPAPGLQPASGARRGMEDEMPEEPLVAQTLKRRERRAPVKQECRMWMFDPKKPCHVEGRMPRARTRPGAAPDYHTPTGKPSDERGSTPDGPTPSRVSRLA